MGLKDMIRELHKGDEVELKDGTQARYVGNKDGLSVLVRRPGKDTVESVFVGNVKKVKGK